MFLKNLTKLSKSGFNLTQELIKVMLKHELYVAFKTCCATSALSWHTRCSIGQTAFFASKGDIFSPFCNVLPTKGDFSFTFPAASATKGDDSVNCCVVDVDLVPFSHKSSLSSPVSHTSVQYLGESLTEILQLEQLLVDSCLISCFSEWGLSSDVHNIPPHTISNTLGDISNISNVVGAEVHVFPDADLEFSAPAVVLCCASNVAKQL